MNTLVDDAAACVARATSLALQADSAAAAEELARLPDAAFDVEAADFRRGMLQRFGPDAVPPRDFGIADTWVAALAKAYVNYWQQVLTRRVPEATAEAELQTAVGALIGRPLAGGDPLDAAEAEIQAEVARRGFHALLGRTAPLRELMLWRKQSVAQVEVMLPAGTYRVTVTYLDDFVLRGWGHYATCGHRSAGGWATPDGLFAVVPAYQRLDDETFSVRFLAHEAQHFADKQTFGTLADWELEYRAKLAELALADTSQATTLELICENRSGLSKQTPHAYANFAVIQNLERRLAGQHGPVTLCAGNAGDASAIQAAAQALLVEDSQKRGQPDT